MYDKCTFYMFSIYKFHHNKDLLKESSIKIFWNLRFLQLSSIDEGYLKSTTSSFKNLDRTQEEILSHETSPLMVEKGRDRNKDNFPCTMEIILYVEWIINANNKKQRRQFYIRGVLIYKNR